MVLKGGVQCVVRRRLLNEVVPGLLPYISEKDIELSNDIIREAHTSERPPGLNGCNMNNPHFSAERTASRSKVGWNGIYIPNTWTRIKLYISA